MTIKPRLTGVSRSLMPVKSSNVFIPLNQLDALLELKIGRTFARSARIAVRLNLGQDFG